jgi:hypothetical protein
MWFPKELFFVVVTIRPASAKSEKDRMIRATRTSINVNPFIFLKESNDPPP